MSIATASILAGLVRLALSSPLAAAAEPAANPPANPVPAVVADPPAQAAWAVVHGSSVWVCWSVAPDCWQRVELGPGTGDEGSEPLHTDLDPDRLRLGFAGARLWIEIDEQRWQLERGHRRASASEAPAPVSLRRPTLARCGPGGLIPVVRAGALRWRSASTCAAPGSVARSCPIPIGPPPRRSAGVRLRAGIDLARTRGWVADVELGRLRRRVGFEALFVIELGFDPGALDRAARARAQLLTRSRRRPLPAVVPGPLAEAEHQAMAAIRCEERRR